MKKQYVFAALLVCRLFVSLFLFCSVNTMHIPANGEYSMPTAARQQTAACTVITYSA